MATGTSRIKNPYYAKQLIDFQGMEVDGSIYPTDIDAVIEYHDSEYILVEVKYKKTRMPYSQRLAIQRMIDDFSKAGKRAIALVAEHSNSDPGTPVVVADCRVRELYYGEEGIWRAPERELTVREAVDDFQTLHSVKVVNE